MAQNILLFSSSSAEETCAIAERFATHLSPNSIIALSGDLGAGKTTFVKGLTQRITSTPIDEICSPTFTYLNIYEGERTVYHFDLYRLNRQSQFVSMGFDDYFEKDGICCIEWPERINDLLPQETITVDIAYASDQTRTITINNLSS